MDKNITFEAALAKLEKIVHELEGGETTLDDSIKLFEEGIKLSDLCSKHLKTAQQKVEILIENGTENPDTERFNENESVQ